MNFGGLENSYKKSFGLGQDFNLGQDQGNLFSKVGTKLIGDKLTSNFASKLGSKVLGDAAMSKLSAAAGPMGWALMAGSAIYGADKAASANRAKSRAYSTAIEGIKTERGRQSRQNLENISNLKSDVADISNAMANQQVSNLEKVENIKNTAIRKGNINTGSVDIATDKQVDDISQDFITKRDQLFSGLSANLKKMGEGHSRSVLEAQQSISELESAKDYADSHSKWYQNFV